MAGQATGGRRMTVRFVGLRIRIRTALIGGPYRTVSLKPIPRPYRTVSRTVPYRSERAGSPLKKVRPSANFNRCAAFPYMDEVLAMTTRHLVTAAECVTGQE